MKRKMEKDRRTRRNCRENIDDWRDGTEVIEEETQEGRK